MDASGRTVGGCSRHSRSIGVTRSRLSARSAPTKSATIVDAGRPRTSAGCVVLREHAADVEDRDAVAHLHRFVDVVGDEHDRLARPRACSRRNSSCSRVRASRGRSRRTARPSAAPAGRRRARGPRRPAGAGRPRAAPGSGRGTSSGSRPTRSSSSSTRAAMRSLSQPSSRGTVPDVGADGLVREQPDLLDHVADAAPQLHRIDVGDVVAVEEDPARASARSSRLIIFSVVVLPQPDGPTSTQTSPAGTSSDELARPRPDRSGTLADRVESDHGRRRIIASCARPALRSRSTSTTLSHLGATFDPRCSRRCCVEDIGPKWLYWPWVTDHLDEIRARLREHIELTRARGRLRAAHRAAARAAELALPARSTGRSLAITGVLYTIPSLALFALLLPVTGLSRATAVIPLTAYTLLILVRNTVTGLDAVPDDVKDAADGMGYTRRRRLLQRRAAARAARDHRRHPHRDGHDDRARDRDRAHRTGRARGAASSTASSATSTRRSTSASCCRSRWRSSPICCSCARDAVAAGGDAVARPRRRRRRQRSRS